MRKTIEVITCDLCEKEISGKVKRLMVPVIFHTEQTEGRGCEPYISMQELDLCEICMWKVTNVHGSGAQGYNHYEFRLPEEGK